MIRATAMPLPFSRAPVIVLPVFLSLLAQSGCVSPDPKLQAGEIMSAWLMRDMQDEDFWREERERDTKAMGTREFVAPYGRVFDSTISALGSMELMIETLDRSSGLIVANGFSLAPEEYRAITRRTKRDWASRKGYNVAALDKGKMPILGKYDSEDYFDLDAIGNHAKKAFKSCTLRITPLDDERCRVESTFANVLYPEEHRRYYEILWNQIDKQLFVDRTIEGNAIDKRD